MHLETVSGNSPSRLIGDAIELARQKSGDINIIYCVFDYDSHKDLHVAIDLFQNYRPKKNEPPIKLIRSSPCFEYWILTHYIKTNKSFYGHATMSPCANVIQELKKQWPDYDKSNQGIYLRTKGNLEKAKENAKWVINNFGDQPYDIPADKNSFTEMHILLEELKQLNEENSK